MVFEGLTKLKCNTIVLSSILFFKYKKIIKYKRILLIRSTIQQGKRHTYMYVCTYPHIFEFFQLSSHK